MSQDNFVNYNNPGQQADPSLRSRVARYIGTHYRNRSRPISRIEAGHRPQQDFINIGIVPEEHDGQDLTSSSGQGHLVTAPVMVPRDGTGIRQDPFGAYPTRQSHAVGQAIDHFIHHYGPAHLLRPEFINPEEGAGIVQQQFQYALQHEAMFEATIALALADSTITSWVDRRPDRRVLYHYGQAVSRLRNALLDVQRSRQDAVLFAIMALMGVDYLLNDLVAFRSHLMGMRQLVHLRGGMNALGWPNLLRPALISLESFWTYISFQPHLVEQQPASALISTTVAHTASTDVEDEEQDAADVLSAVPIGFHGLALQRRISHCLLRIVHGVAVFDSSLEHNSPTSLVYGDGVRKFTNFRTSNGLAVTAASNLQACEKLAVMLTSSNLTLVERVCCIGLFLYLLGSTRSEQLSPVYYVQLQHHARELMDVPLTEDDTDATDLTAWTLFVVSSTMFPFTGSDLPDNYRDDMRFTLAMKLVGYFSPRRDWDEMSLSLRRFIWNDSCMGAWKNVWETALAMNA